ncbi:hypothetical protein SAMD00019534_012280 [Acytostelium subglobosum LB1]|uniref:hypothetical protein n=1 Tax=Acytostelium subglobosum LB1 TaxID=1410327 RepID=UPI0006449706|nr:hypothetical protein SAMD00019534_012280 [Acytostelium subglobosum LB1]GAM18053.1 hypothetical protein SAMD00019534_012280 [Acytostelium subglobosum LB1]|eukprot:XP_012758649.1 hypothetical protein SAMD00019534_012280 [Acytostelium subglobosum LB1]
MIEREKLGKNESFLWELREAEDNNKCADCTDSFPRYMNTSFGTFVCSVCGAIHREFGNRVKCLSTDKFTDDDVAKLKSIGNRRAKDIWLARWSHKEFPIPLPSEEKKVREFIRLKYVEKRWIATNKDVPSPIYTSGHPSSSSSALSPTSFNNNINITSSSPASASSSSYHSSSPARDVTSPNHRKSSNSSRNPPLLASEFEELSLSSATPSTYMVHSHPSRHDNSFPPFSTQPFDQHHYLNEKAKSPPTSSAIPNKQLTKSLGSTTPVQPIIHPTTNLNNSLPTNYIAANHHQQPQAYANVQKPGIQQLAANQHQMMTSRAEIPLDEMFGLRLTKDSEPVFPGSSMAFESGNQLDYDEDQNKAWRMVEDKKKQFLNDHELAMKIQQEEARLKSIEPLRERSKTEPPTPLRQFPSVAYSNRNDYHGHVGRHRATSLVGGGDCLNDDFKVDDFDYKGHDIVDNYYKNKERSNSASTGSNNKGSSHHNHHQHHNPTREPNSGGILPRNSMTECDACGSQVGFHQMTNHKNVECLFRQVKCNYCNKLIKFIQMDDHRDLCLAKTYSCGVCGRQVQGKEMPTHLSLVHNR